MHVSTWETLHTFSHTSFCAIKCFPAARACHYASERLAAAITNMSQRFEQLQEPADSHSTLNSHTYHAIPIVDQGDFSPQPHLI